MCSQRRRREQRGMALGLAVVVMCLLLFAAMLLAAVAGFFIVRRQAQSAADLAALAGAVALQQGRAPCATAAEAAGVNGVDLIDCLVDGERVTIMVSKSMPKLFHRSPLVEARARAGP